VAIGVIHTLKRPRTTGVALLAAAIEPWRSSNPARVEEEDREAQLRAIRADIVSTR